MENISIRIKQLIEALKVSQNSFANSLNASSSRISNITTGRNKPDFDILSAIIEKYRNVNSDWLLTGEGQMFRNVDTYCSTNLIDENQNPVVISGSNTGNDSKSESSLPVFNDLSSPDSTRQNPKPSPSTSPKEIELLYQIIAEKDKRIAEKDEFIKLQRTTIEILEVELARKSSHQKIKVHS